MLIYVYKNNYYKPRVICFHRTFENYPAKIHTQDCNFYVIIAHLT